MKTSKTPNACKSRPLTVKQLNAIDLLAQGFMDGRVAEKLGVTRQTVCDWRNHDPLFAAELKRKREEYWGGPQEKLQTLAYDAITRLGNLMDGPDWDRASQLRVLTTILKLSGLPARQPVAKPAAPVAAGPPEGENPALLGDSRAKRQEQEPAEEPAPETGRPEEPQVRKLTDAEIEAELDRQMEEWGKQPAVAARPH